MSVTKVEYSKWKSLPPPPGFAPLSTTRPSSKAVNTPRQADSYAAIKVKRAWDLAMSPAKSLPMQAFMLYMSGGGVQIFSMGIVFMLLFSPFKNVAAINTAFAPFAPSPSSPKSFNTLFIQKIVYILANLTTLALGLYKCNSMGLLPMGTGDWLAFETRGPSPEISLH
ncbi:DUF1077-domain-containing protein [Thelephora terrestris]|uniref:ER membrane protein complex subunit 4 n=1 Tax=Thelephora terrestris TaxID=56493 RepID=A0A9P6HR25_9AGAM|nr:DUF1077-domain-containing protein [Thelephora terrestris]